MSQCERVMVGLGTDTYDPICELPLNHDGRCRSRSATVEWAKHPGETEDGIRELAIIDRYYALDDLSAVGLGRSFDDVRKVVG